MARSRPRRWPRVRMTTGEILISGTILAVIDLILLAATMLTGPELGF